MELLEWAKPTWPQPSWPSPQGLSARGRSRGVPIPHRRVARQPNPEDRRQVAGEGSAKEVALEMMVPIWGIGDGGAHRGELVAAKQVSGGEPVMAGRRRGGGRWLGVRGAAVSSSGGRCGGRRARWWPEEAGAGEVLTAEEGSRRRLRWSTWRCGGLTCRWRHAQGRRVANGTSAGPS
jgi:hypothetical protein